jgi:hypothetical protein
MSALTILSRSRTSSMMLITLELLWRMMFMARQGSPMARTKPRSFS